MRLRIPNWSRHRIEVLLESNGIVSPVAVVGVREFFPREPYVVDIYEDAVFVITPNTLASFNSSLGVVGPTAEAQTLLNGKWQFKKGAYGASRAKKFQYPAFVQHGAVTVVKNNGHEETGMVGAEICRGSLTRRDPYGSHMIHPYVWDSFYSLVSDSLFLFKMQSFPYLLVTGPSSAVE